MCSCKSCQVGRKIIDDDYDDGFDEIKNYDDERCKYHYNLLRMGAPVLPSVSDLDRKKYSGELFRPRFEQFSRQLIALTSGQWPPQLLAQCLYHCQKRHLTSDAHPQFSCDPVPGPCRNMSTMSQFVNFLPQLFSAVHFLWFKVWQTDQLPSCSGHCPP